MALRPSTAKRTAKVESPKTLSAARAALRAAAEPDRGKVSASFFKTAPGDYGEGDRFLGVTVPNLRRISREFGALPLDATLKLLQSTWHEERSLALLILVRGYERGTTADRSRIHRAYLANTRHINNWDLVDCSAAQIVGGQALETKSLAVIRRFAGSKALWEKRIAMIATFHFIRKGDFSPTIEIAGKLVDDKHDLIQKAVGWMLREVGNRDLTTEERFLATHYKTMPRTALRYAIEKFPEARRKRYLRGDV